MPGWLEDTNDVAFAQGVNVRHSLIASSLATRQNVGGEDLDGIFGLCHEIPVQRYSYGFGHVKERRVFIPTVGAGIK